MEQIEKYIYSIEDLDKCLQSKDRIAIYGAGDYGKRLIDYIISIKKENRITGIIVTEKGDFNCEYKGIKIYEAASFLEVQECFVIIAVSLDFQNDIVNVVKHYGKPYRYMMYEAYQDLGKKLDARMPVPYNGIDFLLAGFVKCGTTSLHSALMKVDRIYLPEKKETQFFTWYDKVKNPKKELIDKFFDNIRAGQVVGMIEPTFAGEADRIYDFFGDKIKIIFLVRNPVDAIFSSFKMHNRNGVAELEEAYQSSGVFYIEMFDEYFDRVTNKGKYALEYIYWIEQFWRYYPKGQVKIVFFEELVKNPQMIINDILKFIGISDTYECLKLPLENEGNFVMADIEGYKLAKLRRDLYRENAFMGKENIQKRYEKQFEYMEINKKYDQAEKIYDLKISKQQRLKAEAYFEESVRKLEAALNKELSQLWF